MKAMRIIVPLVALFFLGAVTAAFFGVRELSFAASLQLIPAILSLSLIPLAVIALVTLLFGRFFCRAMCPLGILQSIVNRIFRDKRLIILNLDLYWCFWLKFFSVDHDADVEEAGIT